MLKLTTFSKPRVVDEDGRVVAIPEKALAALAYLSTIKNQRVSRNELAEFLWGDPDNTNVYGNLRQLIARIKARQREAGFELLAFEGSEVVLRDEAILIDLNDLANDIDSPKEAVVQALAVITGEFLSGISMDSRRAESWRDAERSRHLSVLLKASEKLVEADGYAKEPDLVREACQRILTLDPFNVAAHAMLLRLFASMGRRAQARALFGRYEERVRAELGVAPEAELSRLMRQLFPQVSAIGVSEGDHAPLQTTALGKAASILPRLLILPPRQSQGVQLATALVEDVTIALCQARSVAIVAPYTARQIAGASLPSSDVMKRHEVSYSLETSVSHDGQRHFLFAGLVDVRRDELIWAERFNVSPASLNRSYREVVRNLVVATTTQIERHEFEKIPQTTSPTAYQNYLLGQHNLRKLDLVHLRRARKMFREALRTEPEFPNALSGLARTEHLEWLLTARGDNDLLEASERHARLAMAVDPGHPGGYHQLGVTRLYRSDFDESLSAFEEAEKLAPSHADLIADYADTLVHASNPELAIEKIGKAIDLNPLCPDVYWWTAAGANYCLGNYGKALESINNMDDPTGVGRLAAACWAMQGDMMRARKLMRKTMKIYPDFEVDKWLSIMPIKDQSHKEHYREGLKLAGFK